MDPKDDMPCHAGGGPLLRRSQGSGDPSGEVAAAGWDRLRVEGWQRRAGTGRGSLRALGTEAPPAPAPAQHRPAHPRAMKVLNRPSKRFILTCSCC